MGMFESNRTAEKINAADPRTPTDDGAWITTRIFTMRAIAIRMSKRS
jgi:hypothetical protein